MMKFNKKWLILIFIPLILYFKVSPILNYRYAGTSGDSLVVIDPANTMVSNLYSFRSNLNVGYGNNTANLLSHFAPYLLYELFLFKLGLTQLVRTYLFLILLSFLGCFSMYFYLSKKDLSKNISKFGLFFFSILFGFAPYFTNYYLPGHFLFLLLPAIFPLVQFLFEKITISSKNNTRLSVKYFTILSFILLMLCTSFANLGVLTIFICLMVGQLLINLLLKQINIRQFIVTFFLFFLSLLISNIWWLAPYSVTMGSVSAMSEQSRQTIGSFIGVATANSNVLNTISGFPEGINAGTFPSILQVSLLSLLILCLTIALVTKKKMNVAPILIILITLFFIKGPNPPFDGVFNYLYEKIIYLQIIRRPASKMYWIFIFFAISLIYSTTTKISKKWKYWAILENIFLCSAALLTVFFTFDRMSLTPFNIPISYFQTNQYLIENNVTKILLLPDLGGSSSEYGQNLNYHKGTDFLGQIWEFKKYIPGWPSEDDETTMVKKLAEAIYQNNDFCEQTARLNISHIVLRKDLLPTNYDQKLLDETDIILSRSKYISQINEFGDNFKIFKLIDKCQSKLISTEPDAEIKFEKINPTKFKIHLSTKTDKVTIIYREKFDKSWVLHTGITRNYLSKIIAVIENKETSFNHIPVLDYANGWTVNLADLCSESKNKCVKNGDQYEVDLYIEYWPQRLFYLGLTLSLVSYLLCLGYLCYFTFSKKFISYKQ